MLALAGSSPHPAACFFQHFGSTLLWARALPAAPGVGLWAEKSRAGRAAQRSPGPAAGSLKLPFLRHNFSSSFPAESPHKTTGIRVGTGLSQSQSCH